jgi:hypothetical protein
VAWSECSSTCGTGRQSRRRELIKSEHQAVVPLVSIEYLSQKFESLRLDMDIRQKAHTKDLAFAFAAGCISICVLGVVMRLWTARRRTADYESVQVEEDASE